ncbi:hypothetical protein BLA24_26935 [Streptomyces cinnamoneus]|uniref:Uncharacterized protein n=1 Tax=Streptomyces cinnamoneus TaxID=53446 RepID=A0A2G1XEJ9_STRCJ|nr:hypothetical protein [Streptomyces cinnamoneus]PHQ49653.1 hypothetical protein BLA24_26935 [Streptomyces cinnamoneus]PPT14625.1 hypothetical protein CYQ11_18700 [Streptomyces cinnamoneus]
MGFWGYLLVGRGGARALVECPALAANRDHLVPAGAFGDGWQLWEHPEHPALGDGIDTLVRALADQTGAPALAAYVMESDCAVLVGAGPGDPSWSACLGRTTLARYMAETGLGLDELFPGPEAAAAHCAAWADAAGCAADAAELVRVLAADPEPSVETLFRELLAGLGVMEPARR